MASACRPAPALAVEDALPCSGDRRILNPDDCIPVYDPAIHISAAPFVISWVYPPQLSRTWPRLHARPSRPVVLSSTPLSPPRGIGCGPTFCTDLLICNRLDRCQR